MHEGIKAGMCREMGGVIINTDWEDGDETSPPMEVWSLNTAYISIKGLHTISSEAFPSKQVEGLHVTTCECVALEWVPKWMLQHLILTSLLKIILSFYHCT